MSESEALEEALLFAQAEIAVLRGKECGKTVYRSDGAPEQTDDCGVCLRCFFKKGFAAGLEAAAREVDCMHGKSCRDPACLFRKQAERVLSIPAREPNPCRDFPAPQMALYQYGPLKRETTDDPPR